MPAKRDMNRERILRAENKLLAGEIAIDETEVLEEFVEKIVRRHWWKQQNDATKKIIIQWGRDRSRNIDGCLPSNNYQGNYYIDIDKGSQTRLHVLHSMAHILTPVGYRQPPHELPFVKNYLELTRRFYDWNINEHYKRILKKYLMAEGVKTRTVSDATRQKQSAIWYRRQVPSKNELRALTREIEDM